MLDATDPRFQAFHNLLAVWRAAVRLSGQADGQPNALWLQVHAVAADTRDALNRVVWS
jgi:hypothetical protein